MTHSKEIFVQIYDHILSYNHDERCADDEAFQTCQLYSDIHGVLDVITSKIRLKFGDPCEEDFIILETALNKLRELWDAADLAQTPKVHSLLEHAVKQMSCFGGIGDILEDDIERYHQIACRFEHRTARINQPQKRAAVQSQMESTALNKEVNQHVAYSKQLSKRILKTESNTFQKKLKIE
jgi:hypothetical protein